MPIINQVVKGGGTTPTGTMYIISNGTYNVADKAIANVNVPTTAPARYLELSVNNGVLGYSPTAPVVDFTGITTIQTNYLFYEAWKNNTTIGSVDFSDISAFYGVSAFESAFVSSTISGQVYIHATYYTANLFRYAFQSCPNITSVDIDIPTGSGTLTSAFSSAFQNDVGITNVKISGEISGNQSFYCAFLGCTGITNLDVSGITAIIYTSSSSLNAPCLYMFQGCTGITTATFTNLSQVGRYGLSDMFRDCTNLSSLYFPALTTNSFGTYINQFNNMLRGVDNCTVHFPSNLQSLIETFTGYSTTAPFGATAGTVLFDLPATE